MKRISVSKDTIIWITSILTKIFFQIIYITQIQPVYAYYGFKNEYSLERELISWVLFLPLPFVLIRLSKKETFSNLCVAMLVMGAYLPCLNIYVFMKSEFIVFILMYFVVLYLSCYFIQNKSKIHKSVELDNDSLNFVIILIEALVIAVVLFVWIVYAKLRINFNISDSYVYRMEARTYSMPTIISYGFSMARGGIPLLLVYNLYQRKYLPSSILFATQIVIYFVDGTKSTLFNLATEIIAFLYLSKKNTFVVGMTSFFAGISTTSILEYLLFGTRNVSNYIIRRLFFVPALLNYQYFDFFQKHEHDYYRQSIGILGKSPYDYSIAKTIGQVYYGDPQMSANNGLFSDAYANLGIIGIIVMPIIIVLVFKMIESITSQLPKRIWIVCVIQSFIAFLSSSFFTVLLTHGVIFFSFILYVTKGKLKSTSDQI